jgi:hypothetical protein
MRGTDSKGRLSLMDKGEANRRTDKPSDRHPMSLHECTRLISL